MSTKAQNIHPTHIPGGRRYCPTGKGLGNFPFLSTSSYSYLTKSIARTNFITSFANLIPVESVDRFPNQGTDTLRSELDRVATTGLGHTWTGQDSIRGSITRHPDCTRENLRVRSPVANFDVFACVPSQHDFAQRDPLGLLDVSTEYMGSSSHAERGIAVSLTYRIAEEAVPPA